nr:glycosyltransferase family 4 protein [Deinococcota bacterium]
GVFFTGSAREWRYRQRLAGKLSELVQTGQVTLIEAADCAADAVRYRPGKHPEVPFVVRLHGPTAVGELFDKTIPEFARRVVRRLERRLLLRATHLCAPSQAAAGLFRRAMALGEKPIAVYPNIPTLAHFATAPGVATEPEPNLVLYVGRLSPVKGVHLLVQAIPGVLRRHPQARFVLAGPDGPTSQGHPSAQDYLLSLLPPPCRHAVSFTGYLPPAALARYYERAALCVAPSLFESFGYSCLEAMTHGKAVIGSPAGSMAEMLDHGRCGLLYTPPRIDELSGQMLRLLKDPGLRRSLGAAARARVLTRYRPEVIASRVEAFYLSALADLGGG